MILGKIDEEIVENVKAKLLTIYRWKIKIIKGSIDISSAYNEIRRQYSASAVLVKIKSKYEIKEIFVILTDVDLYEDGLNFVFGLAVPVLKTAIISVYRLNPKFYGNIFSRELFAMRIAKEIVHEIGHLLGLKHCLNNKCVMYFSNSILDTDNKTIYFCDKCRTKIESKSNYP